MSDRPMEAACSCVGCLRSRRRPLLRGTLAYVVLQAALFAGAEASALTINLREVGLGDPIPYFGTVAGPAPQAYTGGGSLLQVMREADRSWETAIP